MLSYLIGCINPSYIFARLKGFDIRKSGSGNAGASNAVITMGKWIGMGSALFDILKACFSIFLATHCFSLSFGFALAAVCCSLGHMFPVFLGFRGGKGLACLAGIYIMYDLKFFFICLACAIVLALVSDYICTVSLTAPLAFTVYYTVTSHDFIGGAPFALMTVAMFCRHIENLRRIRQKTEMRLSYLWNPEKEIDRITEHTKKN